MIEKLGRIIRELRQKQGLSQAQLGEKVGLGHVSIHYIESGQREPRLSYLIKIAQAFGRKLSELIQEAEEN